MSCFRKSEKVACILAWRFRYWMVAAYPLLASQILGMGMDTHPYKRLYSRSKQLVRYLPHWETAVLGRIVLCADIREDGHRGTRPYVANRDCDQGYRGGLRAHFKD